MLLLHFLFQLGGVLLLLPKPLQLRDRHPGLRSAFQPSARVELMATVCRISKMALNGITHFPTLAHSFCNKKLIIDKKNHNIHDSSSVLVTFPIIIVKAYQCAVAPLKFCMKKTILSKLSGSKSPYAKLQFNRKCYD